MEYEIRNYSSYDDDPRFVVRSDTGNISNINYLDVYAKQLSQLTNELLGMQDKYDVTADLDQIERLSSQLEQLKAVVDTLPLA